MKKYALALFAGTVVAGLGATPVQAFQCPALVEQCNTLVAKMEKRANVDKARVARAKAGCERSLSLHKAGKHNASVMEVGKAIAEAGAAAK